jgi:hypothetical protein
MIGHSCPAATRPCSGRQGGGGGGGGGGVDLLLQAAEPDSPVGERGDGVDQVTQRAAEPVELPDHQGVAGAELVQDAVQLRAGGQRASGAAGFVSEDAVAAGVSERVDLEVEVLLGGGDAGVTQRVTGSVAAVALSVLWVACGGVSQNPVTALAMRQRLRTWVVDALAGMASLGLAVSRKRPFLQRLTSASDATTKPAYVNDLLRASKDQPTAVPTRVCAGRCGPSGAK